MIQKTQPCKLTAEQHGSGLTPGFLDYLSERPQLVRPGGFTSWSAARGPPQCTVLSAALFTLFTYDFQYESELCHMQKYSEDTVIVGCVEGGQEDEHRGLVDDFVGWCSSNHLQLNTSKTKEMVVDFRRNRAHLLPHRGHRRGGGQDL